MDVTRMVAEVRSLAGEATTLRIDRSQIVSWLDTYYRKAIDRIPGHQLDLLYKRKETDLVANQNYYFSKASDFPDIIKLGVVKLNYAPGSTFNDRDCNPCSILTNRQGVIALHRHRQMFGDRPLYTHHQPAAFLGYPDEQTPAVDKTISQSVIIIPRPHVATTHGKGIIVDWVYKPAALTITNMAVVPKVPVDVLPFICMGAAAELDSVLRDYDGYKKNMEGWERGMTDYVGPQPEPATPIEIEGYDYESEMT